ncbi:hypothetical protein [Gemmatimonas phototrophica]|uniref:hypothetical protein n=1 Tax=Gemmatimonas phototrophica TaxID=1379270 RepID=UPI001313F08E|nr:hypothetical protein [Gemmatimonas phototrophica]
MPTPRRLSLVLIPAALLSLSACASPTEPLVAEEAVVRRQNVVCIAMGADGSPVFSEPTGTQCPAGFDLQPWW